MNYRTNLTMVDHHVESMPNEMVEVELEPRLAVVEPMFVNTMESIEVVVGIDPIELHSMIAMLTIVLEGQHCNLVVEMEQLMVLVDIDVVGVDIGVVVVVVGGLELDLVVQLEPVVEHIDRLLLQACNHQVVEVVELVDTIELGLVVVVEEVDTIELVLGQELDTNELELAPEHLDQVLLHHFLP